MSSPQLSGAKQNDLSGTFADDALCRRIRFPVQWCADRLDFYESCQS